jgi:hypothetical protein
VADIIFSLRFVYLRSANSVPDGEMNTFSGLLVGILVLATAVDLGSGRSAMEILASGKSSIRFVV